MEPLEALHLGHFTHIVEAPFRGMELLNRAGPGATPPLQARMAEQADAFRARNADTIDAVLRAEAILGKNGLPRPHRPQTLADFLRWSSEAVAAARAGFAQESVQTAAIELGASHAAALVGVQLGAVVQRMLDLQPGHPPLAAAQRELGEAVES